MDQSPNLTLTARLPASWTVESADSLYDSRTFWPRHAWWPLLAFVVAFGVLEIFSLDRAIAREWYFNAHTGWLGSGSGEWWARTLLHNGGRWVVRGVAAAALVSWALSFCVADLRAWRRSSGFVVLSMVLA